jgi:hypothetical protein
VKKKKQQPKLYLDMPFGEAMERFVGVGVDHVLTNIKRAKQKKPPRGKKPPRSGNVDQSNIASLRTRRIRKRNTGL